MVDLRGLVDVAPRGTRNRLKGSDGRVAFRNFHAGAPRDKSGKDFESHWRLVANGYFETIYALFRQRKVTQGDQKIHALNADIETVRLVGRDDVPAGRGDVSANGESLSVLGIGDPCCNHQPTDQQGKRWNGKFCRHANHTKPVVLVDKRKLTELGPLYFRHNTPGHSSTKCCPVGVTTCSIHNKTIAFKIEEDLSHEPSRNYR